MSPRAARPRILAKASGGGAAVEAADRLYLRLDAEGRWTAFGEGGAVFRRAVDGAVLRPLAGGWERLDAAPAGTVHDWVVRRAGELLEALADAAPADLAVEGDPALLRERLRRAACGATPRPAEQGERFARAYPEPVPILPPHRYRDLVVLPATGCPNHSCTFCAFYRDRPFRALDAAAFDAHLAAVRDLFGAACAERDGIFLGSASALSLPAEVLRERLRAVARVFGRPRRGVASFLDPDRGAPRPPSAWAALAAEGLAEATLGLETADPDLRAASGKGRDLDLVRGRVADLRAGGLAVALTVLVGLGGEERRAVHRAATVAFLAGLRLGPRDFVYLSPLRGALRPAALAEEAATWRREVGAATDARVGDYRIERFAWLA